MTTITEHSFDPERRDVRLYRLDNGAVTVEILTLGGTISGIWTPDREGKQENICLGFSSVKGYQDQDAYIGATVGRFANRIARGAFWLEGREYRLSTNSGAHHLHGGFHGLDKKIWEGEIEGNSLLLRTESLDGEEGYPGRVWIEVRYSLDEKNELSLEYRAGSDQDTILNLTNHTYFNLSGRGKGDVLRHMLRVNSDRIIRCDGELIPTGEYLEVEGTPFDFREFHPVGERMNESSADLAAGNGYDHNFVLRGDGFREAAALREDYSGRVVTIFTDMPGLQVYTGNFLKIKGRTKKDYSYGKRSGIALETQFFPDTPNHPAFPSCVVRAGEEYRRRTSYRFGLTGE